MSKFWIGGNGPQPGPEKPPRVKWYPVPLVCPKCGHEFKTVEQPGKRDIFAPCPMCGHVIQVAVTMGKDGRGKTETVIDD
jgi:transcription elongation factor Elf1